MMSSNISVWVSFVLLSPFLVAAGAVECSEKETLLKRKPSTINLPTECLTECSSMTYYKKLQLQDNRNIRMKDSTEGALGEYCWSTKLRCMIGETFLRAYVVLPVRLSAVGHEQLEVRTTDTTVTTLQVVPKGMEQHLLELIQRQLLHVKLEGNTVINVKTQSSTNWLMQI